MQSGGIKMQDHANLEFSKYAESLENLPHRKREHLKSRFKQSLEQRTPEGLNVQKFVRGMIDPWFITSDINCV